MKYDEKIPLKRNTVFYTILPSSDPQVIGTKLSALLNGAKGWLTKKYGLGVKSGLVKGDGRKKSQK